MINCLFKLIAASRGLACDTTRVSCLIIWAYKERSCIQLIWRNKMNFRYYFVLLCFLYAHSLTDVCLQTKRHTVGPGRVRIMFCITSPCTVELNNDK